MNRRLGPLVLITAGVLAAAPELDACGDKSLSAGGIRMQRATAARYPASVLAYVPSNSPASTAARELKLSETLHQVGHRYQEAANLDELRASVETGRFNILVADLAQIADLESKLGPSSGRVVFVPVTYKLTKTEMRAASQQRRFVINAPGKAVEYLTTIAQAVRSRSGGPGKG